MKDKKLLTIAAYAKKYQVSKTHVYSLLGTTLKDCVVEENGIKYIDESKLPETQVNPSSFAEHQEAPAQHQESKEQRQEAAQDQTVAEYKAEIERLKQELAEERRANREKDERVFALMDRVAQLTENTQILMGRVQEQQQRLMSDKKHKQLLLSGEDTEKRGLFSWIRDKITKQKDA